MAYEMALNALGDPTRRLIFNKLRAGPSSVVALSEGLPVSRPAVSQQYNLTVERQIGNSSTFSSFSSPGINNV